jgi:hypothetical protein
MPKVVSRNYVLSGPAKVKFYSQSEMATAMGISESELVEVSGQGVGIGYHAHPLATKAGYEFNEGVYSRNVRVWACLKSGGHRMRPDSTYNHLPNSAETCQVCGHTHYL